MVVSQGDVCWADLSAPGGSGPGYRRPVVIIQCDAINRSGIATALCVPLTSNLRWKDAPGNLLLKSSCTGLNRDSVANVSQIVAIDRSCLEDRVSRISKSQLTLLFSGLDIILGR